MKRSRTMALVLMGTSPLWLSACSSDEPRVEEGLYTSVEACVQQTGDRESCQSALAEAEKSHQQNAPRYATREACVEAHGEGQCQATSERSGSMFMPILAGYMMGRMMNGNKVAGLQSSPAFRNKSGGWERPARADERGVYRAGNIGRAASAPIQVQPNQAPTVSRGGFGGDSDRRSSGG
ncbi:hypothetical protein CO612_05610 [Lysobacteraceae bacterium NML71-0210]|nr:hypothetical protein CO612_05610 [Xanthomonadaceae bacterium NML71-0210]